MFVLALPTLVSVLLALVMSASFTVVLYFVAHRFWLSELDDDTKKMADTIAMRVGVIHAVVIGMMFTNVRLEYTEMIEAIESEASALTRLYVALGRESGDETDEMQKHLTEYLHVVVDVEWPALREVRLHSLDRDVSGRESLDKVWAGLDSIDDEASVLYLRTLLDHVENYRIQRLFDSKGKMLPLFWYIAIIGFLLTILPLCLHPPTVRRYVLVSMYSGMVSLVLLGTFVLSYPYSPAAGVSSGVFEMLIEASE